MVFGCFATVFPLMWVHFDAQPCPGVESDNATGAINCPWQYEELRAWRRRPMGAASGGAR